MRTGRQIDGSVDFRLVVREVFLSVQGEGRNVGMPSVFVRTSGCDHDCSWCDTPEARDPAGGEELSFPELMSRVRRYGTVRRVCLTGGEPLEQANAKMFVQMLLNNGYAVDLETNGSRYLGDMPTHPALTISMDVKTPSSGMSGRTRPDNVAFLGPGDQLKFIIGDGADHDYALDFVGRHRPACRIILTPVGGLELEPLIGLVLASEAWKDWPVQVLPQLHKVVWSDRKGV